MADQDYVLMGTIEYWGREKCYRQMQTVIADGLRVYINDSVLMFMNAVALYLEGQIQESLRQLENVLNKQDVGLASTIAMLLIHKQAKHIEKEAVQMLESKMKNEQKQAGAESLFYGAWFHSMVANFEKAQEYMDRAVNMNMADKKKEMLALKGWVDMMGSDSFASKRCYEYFDKSLRLEGPKHPNALLGKVKFLKESRHEQEDKRKVDDQVLELISHSIVLHNSFLPGLVEKMNFLLMIQDWEQTLDTCQRIFEVDEDCLQARQVLAVYYLVKEVNYDEASSCIARLLTSLNTVEPQNAFLFDRSAKLFSKLSIRNSDILRQTVAMSERALRIGEELSLGDRHVHLLELGRQLLFQGKSKDAMKLFDAAYEVGEDKLDALIGKLRCYLAGELFEEFSNQLEFLQELKDTLGTSAELEYLKGLHALERNEPREKVFPLLKRSIEMHFSSLNQNIYSLDLLIAMDTTFLLEVVESLLLLAPQQPLSKGQAADPVLCQCVMILECLQRNLPGHVEVARLMARTKFLLGEFSASSKLLQQCLLHDPSSTECHLLMAQVYLQDNNFKMANHSLDAGLSYNFKVREHPLFHLIKSRILKKQGQMEEALKTLQVAIDLPGVKSAQGGNKQVGSRKEQRGTPSSDRMSVFLELADAHRILGQMDEAEKVMEEAMRQFQNTGEEARMVVANVDLCLAKGEVEGALNMLRTIGPHRPHYVQAKQKMADIYLNKKRDKKLYINSYMDLYKKLPGVQTGILLGDAYMEIQEPEKAIQSYEVAIKKNPRDAVLSNKIGQALVRTHQYGRALIYYEAALKQGEQQFLRFDLAKLLMLLKQDDKAEKILKSFIDKEERSSDLEIMTQISRCSYLMARICHKRGSYEEKVEHLNRAKDTQERLLMRLSVERNDALEEAKQFAAKIFSELGEHHFMTRNYTKAILNYREAVQVHEGDSESYLRLANLLMLMDQFQESQEICTKLMDANKDKDLASVMLAEVLFKMNDQEKALQQINSLLQDKPDNYAVLWRVIEIMRRAGQLDGCPFFIDLSQNSSKNPDLDSGFNFCKGLYEWYTGDVNCALEKLNRARRDSEFGLRATYLMIEICLNPDGETLGGEVLEGGANESMGLEEKREVERVGLETAEKLLKDIRPRADDARHFVLSNLHLIITRNRNLVEAALSNLLEFCKTNEDNVMALYCTAVAYMMLKQTPKARTQLKRVARTAWNLEDAEYLERSWLLLSDIYIQRENYDQAKELLARCLMYNMSSCKAYEYLGFIFEKNQLHVEASTMYQNAWKFGKRKNPAIGYKLAFNYLRIKKYTDAIDVCHQVLTDFPMYPKIEKDILFKARSMLKT